MVAFPGAKDLQASNDREDIEEANQYEASVLAKLKAGGGGRVVIYFKDLPQRPGARNLIRLALETGWSVTHEPDQRDGDFFDIRPRN
jgi:hypothetical protein